MTASYTMIALFVLGALIMQDNHILDIHSLHKYANKNDKIKPKGNRIHGLPFSKAILSVQNKNS